MVFSDAFISLNIRLIRPASAVRPIALPALPSHISGSTSNLWDQLETHVLLSLEDSAREAVSQHVTSIEEVHRCGLML